MIRHFWTLLCQSSIINQETNNISLIEVIEQLNIIEEKINNQTKMPAEIVSFWVKEDINVDENCKIEFSFIDSDEKVIEKFSHELVIPKGKDRMRFRLRVMLPLSLKRGYRYLITKAYNNQSKIFEPVGKTPILFEVVKDGVKLKT
jgi:hypothetical protein